MALVVATRPAHIELPSLWLQDAGYSVYSVDDLSAVLRVFFDIRPDLTIIDVHGPSDEAVNLVARLREITDAAIVVHSDFTDSESVVRGLESGADEYLERSISREVFVARMASLLRRVGRSQSETHDSYSDPALTVDFASHEVRVLGTEVYLGPIEYNLLVALIENQYRIISHDELLNRAWGIGAGSQDSLKWYVWTLRQKIEADPHHPYLIRNIRGLGYRYFRPPPGVSQVVNESARS